MNYLKHFLLIALCFLAVSGRAAQIPPGLDVAEKSIEKALVTDPDAKSLTGLLKVFSGDAATLELINKLDVAQLHDLALRGGFHGVVMLAFAQRERDNALPILDAMTLSLETMDHIPSKQIVFGESNPFLFYWRFFDQWDSFIDNLPKLSPFLSRATVAALVFNNIPQDALGKLVNAPNFSSLSLPVRSSLLQKAHEDKVIDLFEDRWQPVVDELYQDPDAASVYFLFAKDRGDVFLGRLKDYIVKYENDKSRLLIVEMETAQDLKHIDIMSLPVSDKTKEDLLKRVNSGNSPQQKKAR